MATAKSARARVRAELTEEIKEAARLRLAEEGAQKLSLRAVARDVGMVSSGIYRYFASRDDLLTALIIDAYNALGEAAEQACASVETRRWQTVCHAIRAWARAHPHEYALIYGSPVPGYAAPQETVTAAVRVPLVFLGILRDANVQRDADIQRDAVATGKPDGALPSVLDGQLAAVAAQFAPELSPALLARAFIAWTQLFGMISFELFGQFVGSVDPADAFFDHAVAQMTAFVEVR